jgi:nucleotide-binding universal stress UspA family protein
MKGILIPTDFSECAASAYPYAVSLAKRAKSDIYLLHLLDIPFPSQNVDGNEMATRMDTHFMMELLKLTKSRMEKTLRSPVFKGLNVKEIIEMGSLSEGIFHAVKKYGADMIVMGTHGIRGFQEKFIGTQAEKVVRSAKIPVLSVKQEIKNPEIKTVMFATDFSDEADYLLPALNAITALLNAKLVLTKIITPNKFETTAETEKQIEEFRNKNSLFTYATSVYYAESKEEGIRRAAKALGADMIALGTHGRHGLAHFFMGSIAEDVVSHASLPVLTLNFHRFNQANKTEHTQEKVQPFNSDLLYQLPSV